MYDMYECVCTWVQLTCLWWTDRARVARERDADSSTATSDGGRANGAGIYIGLIESPPGRQATQRLVHTLKEVSLRRTSRTVCTDTKARAGE